MAAVFHYADSSRDSSSNPTVEVSYLRTENRENGDNGDRDENESQRVFHKSLTALVFSCAPVFLFEWLHTRLLLPA